MAIGRGDLARRIAENYGVLWLFLDVNHINDCIKDCILIENVEIRNQRRCRVWKNVDFTLEISFSISNVKM